MDSVREGEGGKIWENGIETCKMSCVKRVARFKVLDLIDRVPEELWTEDHGIIQETGIKTIPMEMKCKKAKWPSEEGLQIAVKRREVTSKGEKERYKHLNAEFQRLARR